MGHVSTVDAIKYGFSLMGYILAVGIATVIIVFIGVAMAGAGADPTNPNGGGSLVGALIMFLGILVFYAGVLGLGYKVIVDGVIDGINRSNSH